MHVFNLVFRGPCKCFIRIANVVTSMKACMKLLLLRHYNPQRKPSLNSVVIFLLSIREVQRLKLKPLPLCALNVSCIFQLHWKGF